jgi:hypothetical protein
MRKKISFVASRFDTTIIYIPDQNNMVKLSEKLQAPR